MSLQGLLGIFAQDSELARAVQAARSGTTAEFSVSGPQSAQSVVSSLLAAPDFGNRQVLVVVPGTHEAEDLVDELAAFIEPSSVAEFLAWETLPHERLSPSREIVGRRVSALNKFKANDVQVVVAGVRALLQPMIKGLAEIEPVIVRSGDEVDLNSLVFRLAFLGYERCELVARRGEFAVRGGIVDVFSPTEDHPIRIEFFGDDIEDVRYFSVSDQRSLQVAEQGLWAPPCRELLLTQDVCQRAAELAKKRPELLEILEPISQGAHVEGMESLAPLLVEQMTTLAEELAHFDNPPLVLVMDPERVRKRADDLLSTSEEFLEAGWQQAADGANTPVDLSQASYRPYDEVQTLALADGLHWWTYSSLGSSENALKPLPPGTHSHEGVLELIDRRVAGGSAVVVVAPGSGSVQRISERFTERDLPVHIVDDLAEAPEGASVTVTTANTRTGLDSPGLGLTLLTEHDLLGTRQAAKRSKVRMPARRRRSIDPLSLSKGDFVVHEKHGVGKFLELTQRNLNGQTREYVVLEYSSSKRGHPADQLFVPSDQLDQVTRYVGGEAPSLHRLGGADWQKSKAKARKAVREIAGELVRLYAARQSSQGRAFGPDTPWQHELEDAFEYTETPDQLASIDEVKADMEKPIPMDRIICGDVGYGKTEIAIRAAFKAVQDGVQVAVLVPTTLLVKQHMETFRERLAPFPIRIEAMSRFQSAKEVKAITEGIADGTVDIVIATHRLLVPSMRFKDLGLVIVDEEQRFGVEHKEHLKALRTNVDVLTLSATPIPRTLEMAVTGIREMSTIQTPPEQRLPVLTYVGEYNNKQIAAAVRRELLRDGQVFYIHNRVESIDRTAQKLSELVPEARVGVAHGQMSEGALENTIDQFWSRDLDVLVCTTIVENGLDISNANTLIVERSDVLGLSQLHQLRGRVGRGRDRAYAYFLYPPEKPLTETAHARLSTIAQNSDLGSGIAVAMKDLEIRGAGNLLGGEQAGHIANVGFDLYIRLVGEALSRVKGEADEEPTEVSIEVPVDSHIPASYVPEETLRLEAYKRLAAALTNDDVDEVSEELNDRYGPIPKPVETLLEVARLRNLARDAGVSEIVAQGKRIRLAPVELPESRTMRLNRLYPGSTIRPATRTVLVPLPKPAKMGDPPVVNRELLEWIRELLTSIVLG